jgi:hypothetical protein
MFALRTMLGGSAKIATEAYRDLVAMNMGPRQVMAAMICSAAVPHRPNRARPRSRERP